jgi:hypothetical protein
MGERTDLQDLLETIMGSGQVYFQPPTTVRMTYPCIVYRRSNGDTKFANNKPYHYEQRYEVTLIDRDPDSVIIKELASLPQCVFDRHFVADNLNHDVFVMYF